MFRAIRRAIDGRAVKISSVHLSESADEVQFMERGDGPWRVLREEFGIWDPEWAPPGVSPVRYLADIEFLDRRTLVIHGVHMSSGDLARLSRLGVTLVACPRSNHHTGAGAPPIADFYASGVRVAIGTDSLASTPDLNMFSELAAVRELAASVPAGALLDSATRQGARALGFDADFGSIEPGKLARLLAVDVPAGTVDVEEYLVSGIRPGQVKWIDA
jgi:cytosine/adenosine deaminase-related metal-dependent hydrolase